MNSKIIEIAKKNNLILPEEIHNKLLNSNLTLAIAESCTAGLISSTLADFHGASKYLEGGVVCYSNKVKEEILSVNSETLEKHGAVSKQVAYELAENTRIKFSTDIGLSVTGIAGPSGGSEEKPVGTVFFGISSKKETKTYKILYPESREDVRLFSMLYSLNLVLDQI